jgi:hypothetical protein
MIIKRMPNASKRLPKAIKGKKAKSKNLLKLN